MAGQVDPTGRAGRPAWPERGAAAVEFAILLPLLVALLFGFIQFGLAFNTKIQTTNAAREGARIAVVGVTDWNNVDGRGTPFWTLVAQRAGLARSALTNCSISPTSAQAGEALTVSFSYNQQVLIPFVPSASFSGPTSVAATMRVEQPSDYTAPGAQGC